MSFLSDLTDEVLKHHGQKLDKLCVVFPTRRAGLFFQKELSGRLEKPTWSPAVFSIRDFLLSLSDANIPDQLTLLFELFETYRQFFPTEDFSRFHGWGEVLLKDFNDIDSYLVNAKKVFATVNDLHEIDNTFELEEEDLERLREFWKNFFGRDPSTLRNEFLNTWKFLSATYYSFKEKLRKKGLSYEGMAYRELTEKAAAGKLKATKEYSHIIFAGFYALTPSEALLMKHFIESGNASAYWDADSYYTDDPVQEAGKFFRNNKLVRDGFLWKGKHFETVDKKIEITGVPLQAGQAKYAGNILKDLMTSENFRSERTAVVLPDEKLLFPVLYSLPAEIKDINVTMGYPLRNTPLYSLFESLISLQKNSRKEKNGDLSFYYRDILNIINHSYIRIVADRAIRNWLSLIDRNIIRLPGSRLVAEGDEGLFKDLFVQVTDVKSIFDWCKRILRRILEAMKDQDFKVHKLEAEFVYHFYTQLKRLEEVLLTNNYINDIDTFWKIFNEVITSVKIPFSGEPLKGLQVMGFLETRVLDFENVIMLSVNEDVLPASGNSPSFIPYNIRKAFGLPTYEDQHAVSAFHFYRLIQRAKNIFLIHNTETKSLTTGERSRFLLQLENELKRKYPDSVHINHKVISTKIGKENILEISVNKSPDVMKELSRFLSTPGQRPAALSASGLISYISCPLKFYYRYVAGLKEQDEPEESMEAATFGKVLHKAMQLLYTNVHTVDSKLIAELKKKINDVVDEAIHSEFISLNQLEGKNILLRNVIRELVKRILDSELPEVPFTIMQIEKDVSTEFKVDESKSVRLLGIIDRLDEKNGVLRVVDYKTGKVDKKKPAGLADYFSDPALKEQFQAMYYAFLTRQVIPGKQIKSGLLAMRDMSGGIWFMNGDVPYSEDQFNEFKLHLQKLIAEIFSPAIPFNQTADKDRCLYCAYKSLCNRSAD